MQLHFDFHPAATGANYSTCYTPKIENLSSTYIFFYLNTTTKMKRKELIFTFGDPVIPQLAYLLKYSIFYMICWNIIRYQYIRAIKIYQLYQFHFQNDNKTSRLKRHDLA